MASSYHSFGEPVPLSASAKMRRLMSLSDEEIEQDIDRKSLSYRQGWPQLPPLPVTDNRHGARFKVNDHDETIEAVRTLCGQQNVHTDSIYFSFRAPVVRDENDNYLTLVITPDLSNDPILTPLIISIRKLLQRNPDNRRIAIEIIDFRVAHGLKTHPIAPQDNEVHDNFLKIYETALKVIAQHTQPFLTMEILRRGVNNNAGQCARTLVITTPTASADIWWGRILPQVRGQISTICANMVVEVLCGTTIGAASSSESEQGVPPDREFYADQVPMGASIHGKNHDDRSATAGGMVKLSNGQAFALTNHHVIRSDGLDQFLSVKGSSPRPLTPKDTSSNPNKIVLNCPSNEDHVAYMRQRERRIAVYKGRKGYEAQLASAEADLKKVDDADRTFARIWASSGLRSVRGEKLSSDPNNGVTPLATGRPQLKFLSDWALSTFRAGRKIINRLPSAEQNLIPSVHSFTLTSEMECNRWTVLNNPHCHVLRDSVNVGKYGRTTRYSYGAINPVPVIINPEVEGGAYKKISLAYGYTVKDCGYAFSCAGHHTSSLSADMLKPGDSGSIILHAPSGKWLGLLFGQTPAGAALFTPIDIVFRDIKEVTGFEVIEPIFDAGGK